MTSRRFPAAWREERATAAGRAAVVCVRVLSKHAAPWATYIGGTYGWAFIVLGRLPGGVSGQLVLRYSTAEWTARGVCDVAWTRGRGGDVRMCLWSLWRRLKSGVLKETPDRYELSAS